jgi:hypothetical protein
MALAQNLSAAFPQVIFVMRVPPVNPAQLEMPCYQHK